MPTAVSTSIAAMETLYLGLSAAETTSATDAADLESTTILIDLGTTTIEAVTTTEAQSTAAATTTSAALEEPDNKYTGLSSPYMAAGGVDYELLCGQAGFEARPLGSGLQVSSY